MERIEDFFLFLKTFHFSLLHFLSTALVSQNFEMQLHCLFQKNFSVNRHKRSAADAMFATNRYFKSLFVIWFFARN